MARVGIIVGEMFEDSEFKVPYDRLKAAGHEVLVIGETKGKKIPGKKGKEVAVIDASIDGVDAAKLDALVIPGGYSPDKLRAIPAMVALTQAMADEGKPIAAICHGPWMLVEANVARGKTLTSWSSIKTDMINAGAKWVDREVVVDGSLITSRKPDDLPAFCEALLDQLAMPVARAESPPEVSQASPR